MNEVEQKFGVWISYESEEDGKWMSDSNNGKDIWMGSEDDAHYYASMRRGIYAHVKYAVRPIQNIL